MAKIRRTHKHSVMAKIRRTHSCWMKSKFRKQSIHKKQKGKKVALLIEEMFINILKTMSGSFAINQYQLIDQLMSTELFQILVTEVMKSQSNKNQMFGYLKNIYNMVINAIPSSSIQKLDIYKNWCDSEVTEQTNFDENVAYDLNPKSQTDKINEQNNPLLCDPTINADNEPKGEYFFNQFQHPCQPAPQLCYALIPKKYANCHHIEYIPCHVDINQLKCKTRVLCKLKCGHEIFSECCKMEENDIKCEMQITHKFEDCGHTVKILCSTDTSKLSCSNNCKHRLPCGHSCPEKCHVSDEKKHETIKCEKKCQKLICKRRHNCPLKCWEECPDCDELVSKKRPCKHVIPHPCSKKIVIVENPDDCKGKQFVGKCIAQCTRILSCGHALESVCSVPSDQLICKQVCEKILECGHKCQNNCADPCTTYCTQSVTLERPCGHEITASCHERNMPSVVDPDNCNELCGATLPCLHECSGTCGQCRQGRLHAVCQNPCKKLLVCGHLCNYRCSSICPPCSEPCFAKCRHSECHDACLEDCSNCVEECGWKCEHFICSKLCHEMCDRPRCNEPCRKKLNCGHQCVGLCGEECPSLCRVCNSSELSEFILSGKEHEDDGRFIKLVDCGHCIEVSGMDNWMDLETEEIKMKGCPRCQTTIWTSNRYGNLIRKWFSDVARVKGIAYGEVPKLRTKMEKLAAVIRKNLKVRKYFEKEMDEFLEMLDMSSGVLCSETFNLVKNQYNVLLSITKMKIKFDRLLSSKMAQDYFSTQVGFLVNLVLEEKKVVNKLMIADVCKEMTRIKFQAMIREDICQDPRNAAAKEILATTAKLSDEDEIKIQKYLNEIFRSVSHYAPGMLARKSRALNPTKSSSEDDDFDSDFRETEDEEMIAKQEETIAKGELNEVDPREEELELEMLKKEAQIPLDDLLETLPMYILEKPASPLPYEDEESDSTDDMEDASNDDEEFKFDSWYKCLNGHFFVITKCGGAEERAKCNECGAAISHYVPDVLPSSEDDEFEADSSETDDEETM